MLCESATCVDALDRELWRFCSVHICSALTLFWTMFNASSIFSAGVVGAPAPCGLNERLSSSATCEAVFLSVLPPTT